MTFESTRDFERIKSVLLHPTQVRMSSEDGTDLENWGPNADERIIYLAVRDEEYEELLGIITFAPQNSICYEVHAALLPHVWGWRSRLALRGALAWAFANTNAKRIVGSVARENRLMIALARDCGMREYGLNPASVLRAGVLRDQVLLGISKQV